MTTPRTLIARGHSWELGNLDGAAWVELRHAEVPFHVDEVSLVTHLPPDLLDAIAAAHAAGRLPHQNAADTPQPEKDAAPCETC
jgi:hypothetical protein